MNNDQSSSYKYVNCLECLYENIVPYNGGSNLVCKLQELLCFTSLSTLQIIFRLIIYRLHHLETIKGGFDEILYTVLRSQKMFSNIFVYIQDVRA